jgi:predicted ester cyclase
MSTDDRGRAIAERNAALFRRVIEEGFNAGRLAVADEVIAPDQREHQPGLGPGPEGLKGAIRRLRSAFPDLTLTIEDITADGDKVWARLKARGTQRGPHMGRPPTGRRIEIDVIDVCRFADGQLVEHWGVPDRFTLLEQLGLLPPPPTRAS